MNDFNPAKKTITAIFSGGWEIIMLLSLLLDRAHMVQMPLLK
jgi:hypothetical protein